MSESEAVKALAHKIEEWAQHVKPGSEWHGSECCVDEAMAELSPLVAAVEREMASLQSRLDAVRKLAEETREADDIIYPYALFDILDSPEPGQETR